MEHGDSEATLAPIAADDVQAELCKLRRLRGMTRYRIREFCPNLKALRVTQAELRARHLHPDDVHVAAYEALACAVRSLIQHSDYSRILAKTLNIAASTKLLEQRRKELIAELFLTEKEYRGREAAAYSEFAGVLTAATDSPCALRENIPEKLQVEIQISATSEDLKRLLNLLTLETREAIRIELARAIMEILPGATAVLARHRSWLLARRNSLAVLQGVVLVLLRYFNLPMLSQVPPTSLLSDSDLWWLLFDNPDNDLVLALREPGRSQPSALASYYARKEQTLSTLADVILRMEDRGTWSGLLPWPSN